MDVSPRLPRLRSPAFGGRARLAVRETLAFWGTPPPQGFVSFVDTTKVRTARPGWCYLKAGWKEVGRTKGGLLAFQLEPSAMQVKP